MSRSIKAVCLAVRWLAAFSHLSKQDKEEKTLVEILVKEWFLCVKLQKGCEVIPRSFPSWETFKRVTRH